MAKDEYTIHLHRPSINELMFFLLSGAILSVPLTIFISQYATALLGGFSIFSATLISVAIFAPIIEEFSKIFPLFYRHGETQRSIFHLALMVGFGFWDSRIFDLCCYRCESASAHTRIAISPSKHSHNSLWGSYKESFALLSCSSSTTFLITLLQF